jgi:hypothetical protein
MASAGSAKAKGSGYIGTETGVEKVENFATDLFKKVPQDVSFTKKNRDYVPSAGQLSTSNPLVFHVPGEFCSRGCKY